MKKVLVLAAAAALFASCGPKAEKPDTTAMVNDSLAQVVAAKDSIMLSTASER